MKIIYTKTNGEIVILMPCDCGLTIEQIAQKDVPFGAAYLIVQDADLPEDWSASTAWECDFSNPHGIGLGPQRYFIAQAEAVLADADASDSDKSAAAALKAQMEAELETMA